MLQSAPVPAPTVLERLRAGAGRRALGIGLALLIEGLLLLLLLTLGAREPAGERGRSITVVNFEEEDVSEEAAEERSAASEPKAEERPTPPQPVAEEPFPRSPVAPAAIPPPPPIDLPAPARAIEAPRPPAQPAPSARKLYGPPDRRGPASPDTERVGTAPNGEPLYAAAWYREPRDDELSGYLSTARGPGWGLIACRTVPDYRVEDCVALAEYPEGSQINRAVLAAAWQFKVRPPQLGGRPQVGSWVRIRIDYGIRPR